MAHRGTLMRLRYLKQCVDALESDISASYKRIKLGNSRSKPQLNTFAPTNARAFSVLTCERANLHSTSHVKPSGFSFCTQNPIRNASTNDDHSNENINPRTEVSYEELVKLIDGGNVLLFDVREPKEIEQTGLMPGAVNIPITKLKGSLALETDQFKETFNCQKPEGQGENVLFCGFSNVKSEAALELAHKAGFKKARHYPGGWREWSEKQSQS